MTFKNEYVPPRDSEGAAKFVREVLAKHGAKPENRKSPHPLEHYSVRQHRMSPFVREARDKLRTGHSVWDMWTIDHELEMVLKHDGGGREDSPNSVMWKFLDQKGLYHITTEQSRAVSERGELEVTHRIVLFWSGNGYVVPDADSLKCFKQALDECHRYSLFDFSAHPERHITLIDGRTDSDI